MTYIVPRTCGNKYSYYSYSYSVWGILYYTCLSDRAGRERLGESHLCKRMAGAVPSITNIYSLVYILCDFHKHGIGWNSMWWLLWLIWKSNTILNLHISFELFTPHKQFIILPIECCLSCSYRFLLGQKSAQLMTTSVGYLPFYNGMNSFPHTFAHTTTISEYKMKKGRFLGM